MNGPGYVPASHATCVPWKKNCRVIREHMSQEEQVNSVIQIDMDLNLDKTAQIIGWAQSHRQVG